MHNAARISTEKLTYDVDNLVLKVYAEFSNSAKRVKELQFFLKNFKLNIEKFFDIDQLDD